MLPPGVKTVAILSVSIAGAAAGYILGNFTAVLPQASVRRRIAIVSSRHDSEEVTRSAPGALPCPR